MTLIAAASFLEGSAFRVTLIGVLAGVFKALLGASGPLDKPQLKLLVWKTHALSDATVQNAVTGLRRLLRPLFDDPVPAAAGKPARYTLNLGLPLADKATPAPAGRWPARLIVCASQSLCRAVAAGLALQAITVNPGAGIVLGTGRTAVEVFHAAVALAEKRHFPGLERARYFIDMEALGVTPAHRVSRHAFARANFIEPLRAAGYAIREDRLAFFKGAIVEEGSHFERFDPIIRATPLALHLVSVSPQGGLIGHSAGTGETLADLMSDCRTTILSEADRRYSDARLPSRAMVSIGLLNMLRADELVVPVYHEAKADILRVIFSADPDPAIPATLLKYHGRATIITTQAMAGKMPDCKGAVEIANEREAVAKLGLVVV